MSYAFRDRISPRRKMALEEAKRQGQKYYSPGEPCRRGHNARFLVSSDHCEACARESRERRYGARQRQARREFKEQCRSECVQSRTPRAGSTLPATLEDAIAPGRLRAQAALSRLQPGQMPRWADAAKIEAIYLAASLLTYSTQAVWHVDHDIALKDPACSGLHVEDNLRIVTAAENLRKGNRSLSRTAHNGPSRVA